MFTPPATITFLSDSNVLQFTRLVKGKTPSYVYTYIKSSTKKGRELPLSEEDIINLKKKR